MPVNQRKITKEFCEGTASRGGRLYFPADTREDAQKIQAFFFELGYGWCGDGCTVREIEAGDPDYIYFDSDKTLMQGSYSEDPNYWICTVQQLDPKGLSVEHQVMMEEIREMQRSFKEEIAGLKAEILALKNEINPPVEKKVQLPQNKKASPGSSDAPSGSPV